MSSLVPDPPDDYPPSWGEESSHPEHPQDLGQTKFGISKMLRIAVNAILVTFKFVITLLCRFTTNSDEPDPPNDIFQALGEEPSHPEYPQDPGETNLSGVQQVIITAIRATLCIDNFSQAIRATDLTLGLRRIPAGFYVVVKTDGAACQTSNKPVHVDQALVEWNEHILLPCRPYSKVRVSVYASFELGPMLCHGKVLRAFDISVGELLKRSEKSHPIIFQPDQGEVVSSCASLLMLVEQRRSDENDALVLRPLTTLTSGDMDALVLRTDAGHGLLARYRKTQSSRDLGQSIKHFEHALDICSMDHPCLSAALFNLAIAKFVSCQANGAPLDLDISIALFQDALDLRPTGHPDRHVTQLYLAISLRFRFAKRGYRTDADAAEESLSEVLDVCHANSHIYRAALLAIKTSALYPAGNTAANDLGQERLAVSMLPLSPNQLVNLAEQCLGRDDYRALDEVISLHYNALGYYDAKHVRRGQLLTNLCVMLITRFERRSNHGDLDRAIALQREALELHPAGHPDRFSSLNNLANQLSVRFDHRGNDEDLDQAIVHQMEAQALCPVGHPDRSMSLNNLANELSTRFRHRGNDEDLDQAIALQREAQTLFPVGHPNRSSSLSNLATELSTRFDHRGNDGDLDDAIALQSEALALRPAGHLDRPSSLNNLANLLSTRFEHQGNGEDLDAAIALHREVLALCPVGHTTRSSSLSNLAGDLSTRFEHRGNDEDLDDAIALLRESMGLRPPGHDGRSSSMNNLANQLSTRFRRRGNDEDLDIAIALRREALALCPIGHASRSFSLNNIAGELSTRFDNRGNDEDLDDAIVFYRESLALRPVGHVYRPSSLHNLADRLSTRFEHQRNEEDLNESRENLRSALTLLTQHDPRRLLVYKSLATVYLLFHQSGFDGTGPDEDIDGLNAAMDYLKAAANVVSGGLLFRLRASLSWVHHANRHTHSTELEAYATSIQLLDAYMSATASVSSRHSAMMDFPPTLAADAASCAIRSGDVRRAVELLEQGRTLIWTQMARFRTPLDSLPEALTKTFRDISFLLDKPPANHPEGTSIVVVEAEATRYRRLMEDWNGAVEEIRKIEGFSRFLLSPVFSDLQNAACDGPIIVLIASKSSCDAIIIPHKQSPTSIQLPTNFGKLQKLVLALKEARQKEPNAKGNQPALTKALRELWDDIVCPVVKRLNGFAPRNSRIWWCPTSLFNFLPLHATGEYRAKGNSLSQQYISSYTPSLTALMKARRSHNRPLPVPFAAIGQNCPAGHSVTLECVEPELELVRSLLPPPPTVSFTKIPSADATKSRALCALKNNTWLHFACHGTQKLDEPFNSAFLMQDHPLSLLDITHLDLSQHEFAFLSACETAVGVTSTPDEVIHLAAGLQFAGVKSVVGTLWKVTDATVQRLVEEFYKNLCGDGKMDSKRAAEALRQAVRSLACEKDIPLDQRIVFMHIGV